MLKCWAFIIVLTAASATALTSMKELNKVLQQFTVGANWCIAQYCPGPAVKCAADPECIEAISCILGCLAHWNQDPTPQKYIAQNCTNKCAYTYGEGEAYQSFIGCITDGKCITFPGILPTCSAASAKPIKQLSTKDLEGKWWVVRGYNKLYDCYPCHSELVYANGSNVEFRAEFDTYLNNGSLKQVYTEEEWLSTQPGKGIPYLYRNLGLIMNGVRWLLDKADDSSWIILSYCGNSLQWFYEGAQVLSKKKVLDNATYEQIAASFKQAVGLNLDDFCAVRNTACV